MAGIVDLGTLKTAVQEWADYTNVSDERVTEFVQLTTHVFNYGSADMSALRLREMESVETLTPVDFVSTLPTDYLQYRRVIDLTVLRNPLTYITPQKADEIYPDRSRGAPQYFTIIGQSLYTYPVSASDLELTYYAKIPDLANDTDTNWLLDKYPVLYLHGTLAQLGLFTRDEALASRSSSIMSSMLSGIVGSDTLSMYAYAPGMPRGMTIA